MLVVLDQGRELDKLDEWSGVSGILGAVEFAGVCFDRYVPLFFTFRLILTGVGTIGFIASWLFTLKIYRSIKVD